MRDTLLILAIEEDSKTCSLVKQCTDIHKFTSCFFYSDDFSAIIKEVSNKRPDLILINYNKTGVWQGVIEFFSRNHLYFPLILFSDESGFDTGKVEKIEGVWDTLSLHDISSFKVVLQNLYRFIQTERKTLNEESYSKIRSLYHELISKNATEGILVVQDGLLKYMDYQISNFLGYDEDDLKSIPFLELVHPEDRSLLIENYQKRIAGKKVEKYRLRVLSKNNDEAWLEITGLRIEWEGKPASLCFVTEISERVHSEKSLRDSEAKYKGVVLSSPNGIIVLDINGIIVDLNPALTEMTGYSKESFLGKPIVDISAIDEESKTKAVKVFREIVSGERTEPVPFEVKFTRKDGNVRFTRVNVRLIQHDEEPEGVMVTCTDITEQKISTEKIISSEGRFRDLHERMLESLVAVDLEGDIIEFNNSFRKLTGYSEDELLNMNVDSLIPVEWESLKLELNEDIKSELVSTQPYEMEIRNSRNELIPVEVHCYLNEDDNITTGYWCFLKDIRLRKKYENELIERDIQTRAILEYLPTPVIQEDLSEIRSRVKQIEKKGVTDLEKYFHENPRELKVCCKSIKIVDCNQAALHFFGAENIDELKRMNIYMQSQEIMDSRLRMVNKFVEQHTVYEEEVTFELQSGMKREALLKSVILPGKEISWDTVLVAMVDLSEIIVQEKQIKVLSQAITHSPASVIITDTEGKIEYVNPKFTEVTGYTEDDVYGKTPSILKSGNMSPKVYEELWQTLISGGEWIGEFENKKKNGEIFWELASISAVKNDFGEVTHFVAIKEDITEKKKIESILLNAKQRAEESDGLKTAFLANMSHEIRTPMNAIVGFSELLRTTDVSGPDKEEYFNIINSSCNTLSNLIDDIIDLAKIEAGQTKVVEEVCHPVKIMKELNLVFEKEVKKSEKSLQIEMDLGISEGLVTKTDEFRLRQVITNILSNALKFTQDGLISWGCLLNDNDELVFYFKDTGIGIEEGNLSSIFDRFRQLDGSSVRKFEGTGLGLSVSKSLVEMMGGRIWVESKINIGSEFYFTIPYKPADTEIVSIGVNDNNRQEVFNWEEKVVLVVEDNESNFEFIKAVLSKTNARLLWAVTGTKAIEIFKENDDIDLVLMDIQIPELDGYKVTRIIKEIKHDTPVIAQTAYAMSQDRERSLQAGCNDYIAKPIKPLDLLNLIGKYI